MFSKQELAWISSRIQNEIESGSTSETFLNEMLSKVNKLQESENDSQETNLWTVNWSIEVEADNAVEAALVAMEMMPKDLSDPEDQATVFDVAKFGSKVFVQIDLLEEMQ